MIDKHIQYYRLCGFTVRSEIPLPELPAMTGDSAAATVDLDIRFGPVPERLDDADHVYPRFETAGSDRLLVKATDIARFLLRASGDVTVDPWGAYVEKDVRSVLLASVMGGFFHMRGLYPLHASAVRFGNGVVAFAGASGIGKSTLAAFLGERGYQVFTDDICVVDPGEAGAVPHVRPSFARLRLWPESMDALGIPLTEENRNTVRWRKFHHHLPAAAAALPLRAVVLPVAAASGAPHLVPVPGSGAMARMLQNTYRAEYARFLGLHQASFGAAAAIAAQTPIFELVRRRDFNQMEEVVAVLETAFG